MQQCVFESMRGTVQKNYIYKSEISYCSQTYKCPSVAVFLLVTHLSPPPPIGTWWGKKWTCQHLLFDKCWIEAQNERHVSQGGWDYNESWSIEQ